VSGDQENRLRADARRNRERILAAAKTWFAAQGPEASAEGIARAAGVAPGTLYRHFPDRPALIHAVALNNLENALAEAHTAAAEEDTGWDALVRILRQSYELRLSFQLAVAYPQVRAIMKTDAKTRRLRRSMLEVLDGVVRQAQAEGSLRTDIGTGDVAVLFTMLARAVPLDKEHIAKVASARCMALLLDSLRPPPPGTRLPGDPITPSDLGA
jgi:AcrR family transcriptional regulator